MITNVRNVLNLQINVLNVLILLEMVLIPNVYVRMVTLMMVMIMPNVKYVSTLVPTVLL